MANKFYLEPCPFCGHKAHLVSNTSGASGGFYVRCGTPGSVYEPKTGCGARSHLKPIRAEAVEVWNRRNTMPHRSIHRTLVRIEGIVDEQVSVVLPGWDHEQVVLLDCALFPESALQNIRDGFRYCYARVNLAADTADDLCFDFMQMGPKQAPTDEELFGDKR